MEIFCNIINVFTDTFGQFNASLLNIKVLISLKKNVPQFFENDIYRICM